MLTIAPPDQGFHGGLIADIKTFDSLGAESGIRPSRFHFCRADAGYRDFRTGGDQTSPDYSADAARAPCDRRCSACQEFTEPT